MINTNSDTPNKLAEEQSSMDNISENGFWERVNTQWQFGDWNELSKIQPTQIANMSNRGKLTLYVAVSNFQIGNISEGKELIKIALRDGVKLQLIVKFLVAGAYNNLANALAQTDHKDAAVQHLRLAVSLFLDQQNDGYTMEAIIEERIMQMIQNTSARVSKESEIHFVGIKRDKISSEFSNSFSRTLEMWEKTEAT